MVQESLCWAIRNFWTRVLMNNLIYAYINKLFLCNATAWSLRCYQCSTRNQQECESTETLKDCPNGTNDACLAISKTSIVTDEKQNTARRTTYWKGCSYYGYCKWNCGLRNPHEKCKV